MSAKDEPAWRHCSLDPGDPNNLELVQMFKDHGFETILSIGEPEENQIGSN